MEQAYAQALWDMLERGQSSAHAVKALREGLERRGRMSLMPRIARAFRRIAEREARRTQVTLTIARAADEHAARRSVAGVLEEFGAHENDLVIKVDPSIIGGARLEGRGRLVDASYKKYLLDMYTAAVR